MSYSPISNVSMLHVPHFPMLVCCMYFNFQCWYAACTTISNVSMLHVPQPLFQYQCLYSVALSFTKNISNRQVRNNKITRKHSVDYHPSPAGLNSDIYSVIFLQTTEGFDTLQKFSQIFSQICLSKHDLEKSSNFDVQIAGKCIYELKKWKLTLLIISPRQNSSPCSYLPQAAFP